MNTLSNQQRINSNPVISNAPVKQADLSPHKRRLLLIKNIANRFFSSPTLRFLLNGTTLAGSVAILALSSTLAVSVIAVCITVLASIALVIHSAKNAKKIAYEVTLFAVVILNAFKCHPRTWWDQITPHLYLGAMPLKNFDHHRKLSQLNVQAVLSMTENFEFYTKSLLSVPCTSADWKERNIQHLNLSTKDFRPIPLEILEQGVAFLEQQIRENKRCYVHCKAGKSRSSTTVLAYLLKQKIVPSIDEGLKFLQKKHPFASLSTGKRRILEQYFRKHCTAVV